MSLFVHVRRFASVFSEALFLCIRGYVWRTRIGRLVVAAAVGLSSSTSLDWGPASGGPDGGLSVS